MTPRKLRIVGVGDSTTAGAPEFLSPLESPPQGYGNRESQYAHWIMKAHPEWEVLNRGVNGQRSDEILSRFNCDVVEERPDYVIILAGVNDVYQGASTDSIERNLKAMYMQALEQHVVPVAATVLPYDSSIVEAKEIQKLNAWIIETANRLHIPLADTNLATADPADRNRLLSSVDGLHPDVSGYHSMGVVLAQTIEHHLRRIEDERGKIK